MLVELNGDMRGDGSDFYESDAMLVKRAISFDCFMVSRKDQ